MNQTPREPNPLLAGRPWAGRAALAFVLLTLGLLVAIPILVQRRVEALDAEIAISEPARTLVAGLRFDLVREMVALGDASPAPGAPDPSATYAAARADERAIYAQLAPLAERLGPEVAEHFARVRLLADQWHAGGDEVIARRRTEGGGVARMPVDRERFEAVLGAAAAMDSAILRATSRKRDQIRSAERIGLWLTLLSGTLAVLAAGVVAALTSRVRRYAAEAERRREEAEAALAETARANEARARLLRGITHDVKNPLGAAQGYAQLLAMGIKGPISPEQASLVRGVQRSVDAALAIIADLLDVARADGGGLTVERVPADLASVAREAVEDHRAAAEAAGHVLDFGAPGRPVPVHTDPGRVRQVLANLLSNAIKYTPAPGRITVVAEPAGEDGAVVRVTDTGPGIAPEMRDAVFDEFTRLDEGSGTKGHGLGLAIARRIARLLGGDLTVGGTTGPVASPGATFILWLPLGEEADAPGEAPPGAGAAR